MDFLDGYMICLFEFWVWNGIVIVVVSKKCVNEKE